MPDYVFNVAKGRAAELYKRVDDGDPANARLLVVPINTATADGTLQDLDTLAAVLGDAGTTEASGSGWTRKTITAADIAYAPDDTNNRVDLDIPDQTWTAVSSATASTDLLICYIPDGVTPGADSTVIPLSQHDFAVTPDGSDITAQIATAGFFRAQ